MCRIVAVTGPAVSISCGELTYFTYTEFCSSGVSVFSRLRAVLISHLYFDGVKVSLSCVAAYGCMFGGNGSCVVDECDLYGVYLAGRNPCPCAAHWVKCVCVFYCIVFSFVERCASGPDDIFVSYAAV